MRRPATRTILIGFSLFLFFLVLRFPFSNLKGYIFSQINRNTGISVVFAEDLYLTLIGWPGVGMKNVEVIIPAGEGEIDMTAKRITARVGIGSIFPPSLSYSIAIDGLKKGGDLFVKLSNLKQSKRGVTGASIYFSADKVDLSQFPIGGQPLLGKLSGELVNGTFQSDDLSKTTGNLTLNLENISTPPANAQGFSIPPIRLGDVKAKIQARNGTVELTNFQMSGTGTDLEGQLGGEIRLLNPMAQSSINITIRLKVSDSFAKSETGVTLITMLDNYDRRTPGKAYNLRWNQTFNEISQQFPLSGPVELP